MKRRLKPPQTVDKVDEKHKFIYFFYAVNA